MHDMAESAAVRPPVPRRFAALLGFLRSEAAGGVVLMAAAAVALLWANSPARGLYARLLHAELGVSAGPFAFAMPAELWVNDALMVVFFLLVGLEIRREMTEGQLASLRAVAAPGLAALGGMVAPALIYVAFNHANPSALRGWAVPVATDIAFSLAVLSVLGRRVPVALKVFLTALAILDDLGAIVVIALFYTRSLDLAALLGAVLVWVALFGLNRARVRALTPYLLGGALLWALVFHSGVHATLAGVALAFVVPMHAGARAPMRAGARAPVRAGEGAGEESPAHRLEAALGPWVAFLVLPLFGLANAGLSFGDLPAGVLADPLALGIFFGLVVGKQLGVFGAVMAARRLGLARLPSGVTPAQLYGAAILCGIGFTMSLFIGDLAFRGQASGGEAKLAVFAGSLVSALLGLGVLALAGRRAAAEERAGLDAPGLKP